MNDPEPFESLELDLDWETAPTTQRSRQLLLPPALAAEGGAAASPIDDRWSLEWIEDLEEPPSFGAGREEAGTRPGTPEAKRHPTLRAAPPPPSLAPLRCDADSTPTLAPSARPFSVTVSRTGGASSSVGHPARFASRFRFG